MQDSEQQYPLHQPQPPPQRNGRQQRQQQQQRQRQRPRQDDDLDDQSDYEDTTDPDLQEAAPTRRQGVGPVHQREEAEQHPIELPQGGRKNALIIGVISGLLCALQSIFITLINAPTYHAFDVAKDKTTQGALAFTIFGFNFLTFVINVLIWLIAGFIVGKVIVRRRLGFLAGFVSGIVLYVIYSITHLIPSYPGNSPTPVSTNAAAGSPLISILFFLAIFVLFGIVGGL